MTRILASDWLRSPGPRVRIKNTALVTIIQVTLIAGRDVLLTIWSYSIVTLNIIKIKFTASLDTR